MPELAPEIKRNLKDRWGNVKGTVKQEVDVVKSSFKLLTALKPVPAVTGVIADTVDTARDFLDYQASVFRRWID